MPLAVLSVPGVKVTSAHTLIRYFFMCTDLFCKHYRSHVIHDDVWTSGILDNFCVGTVARSGIIGLTCFSPVNECRVMTTLVVQHYGPLAILVLLFLSNKTSTFRHRWNQLFRGLNYFVAATERTRSVQTTLPVIAPPRHHPWR